jgi:TPR repeat protein/serine/threonine protein kinase
MPITVSVGHTFARDYRIVRPLREGGMGAVYVVEQLSTGSQRALKLMHPQLVQDARLRQRFEQEARVGARIESDHIVQVLAAGVDPESGFPFLVMELLRGEDLEAALRRRGPFSPVETREIFAQLCHALAAAHAVGVVHRDLKPENIFLAAANREGVSVTVKVLDFGIAKVVADAQTHQTAALGTPLWMAPEQTTPNGYIGPQTDVWALGLIAFRMLTGRNYWIAANTAAANTAILMREILMEPVMPASQRGVQLGVAHLIPPGFDDWFARCVDRNPAGRFGDASAARNALGSVIAAPSGGQTRSGPGSAALPMNVPTSSLVRTAPKGMPTPHGAYTGAPQSVVNQNYRSMPAVPAMGGMPAVVPATTGGASLPALVPVPPSSAMPKKKSGASGLLVGALGGVLLLGAIGLVANKVRSSRDQSTCEKMVTTADEAKDPAAACQRACAGLPAACITHGDLVRRYSIGDKPLEDAKASYKKGCDGGEQRGCRAYASLLERTEPSKAADLYKTACDKGDAAACTLLGVLHEEGRGVTRDASRALSLYNQACKATDKLGCAYQAFILAEGLGVRQDEGRAADLAKEAANWLAMECDASHPKQCVALGSMLASGMGGAKKDEAKALELMQKACDASEPSGCANLGTMKLFGVGGPKNLNAAIADLKKACDDGEYVACTSLGILNAKVMFVVRRGVRGVATLKLACHGVYNIGCSGWGTAYPPPADMTADAPAGVALSTKACDAGELTGCVNLGAFLQYGTGTAKNRAKASELFKKACDGGNGDGCGELGSMYQDGRGVPADAKHAMELLNQSCDFGEKDSCVIVAANKMGGVGTTKAPDEGAAYLKRSCDKEHVAMGCTNYAQLLVRGFGVPKDLPTGVDILKRACEAKYERLYPRACVILGDINATGGPAGKDLAAAAKLYQAACDQNELIGCTRLAFYLADGIAVPKDPVKALAMLEAGCKAGDAGSCDSLGNFHALGKAGLTANGAKGIEYLQMACDDPLWSSCATIGNFYLNGVGGLARDRASATKYLKLACDHGQDDACLTMKKNQLQ